jgi:hypothetical protein
MNTKIITDYFLFLFSYPDAVLYRELSIWHWNRLFLFLFSSISSGLSSLSCTLWARFRHACTMSLRLPDCQCQVELRSVPCGLGFSRGLLKRTKTGSLEESPITRRHVAEFFPCKMWRAKANDISSRGSNSEYIEDSKDSVVSTSNLVVRFTVSSIECSNAPAWLHLIRNAITEYSQVWGY